MDFSQLIVLIKQIFMQNSEECMIGWYGRTARASLNKRAFSCEIPMD
jgi:hypothetical protein